MRWFAFVLHTCQEGQEQEKQAYHALQRVAREGSASDAQEPARPGLGEERPKQRAGPGLWHVN